MPTASDFPNIRAVALEERPSPNNPLGAKGAGEGGIIPVGGVIANAVAAALGSLAVTPRELPLSPPRAGDPRADCRALIGLGLVRSVSPNAAQRNLSSAGARCRENASAAPPG
jgi:hypothetical protein